MGYRPGERPCSRIPASLAGGTAIPRIGDVVPELGGCNERALSVKQIPQTVDKKPERMCLKVTAHFSSASNLRYRSVFSGVSAILCVSRLLRNA